MLRNCNRLLSATSIAVVLSCQSLAVIAQSNGAKLGPSIGAIQTAPVDGAQLGPSNGAILTAGVSASTLKGSVTQQEGKSPLLTGSVQALPKGTKVDLTAMVNINSEISQKGDEIWMQISHDVGSPGGISVPGGWYVHGLVTEAMPQRRQGKEGFVNIQFDKIVSPDKQTELPFDAKISTKEPLLKAAARQVAADSLHVGIGALGGALLSVQMTGIPTAIATHGISVGVGAGIGGAIGVVGALKRKGIITSVHPGEEIALITADPIILPGFNEAALPSAKPVPVLENFNIKVNKVSYSKDPLGDASSKLLWLNLTMNNQTPDAYKFTDLTVVSDHNQRYYPSIASFGTLRIPKVEPNETANAEIAFTVDGKKHKYWLVLTDKTNQTELSRFPIN